MAALGLGQEQQLLDLVSSETVLMLWFHNLRAMMLGSIAGMLTFGILGCIDLAGAYDADLIFDAADGGGRRSGLEISVGFGDSAWDL